jgi:hypothetical protein
MASKTDGGYVLLSTEVELYVQALEPFSIDQIASQRWSSQREMIEKLNMQAVVSASSNETEYVKDALVTYEKVSLVSNCYHILFHETDTPCSIFFYF